MHERAQKPQRSSAFLDELSESRESVESCWRSFVTGSVTEFRAGGPEFFFKAAAIHLDPILRFMSRSVRHSDGAAWISGASVEKLGVTVEKGRAAKILAAALPFFVSRSATMTGPAVEIGGRRGSIAVAFE